ncbi:MAG: RIP metalloprotease RseP [Candidatus Kerfeldbacteria bacterium]|nr:RIP metalloprotease RseP [Candidatus Kerfeldbacteria bacterium]
MSTIIIFIIVLGFLVCIHEFGHFIAAKRAGIQVDEFGFGFPPRIIGKKFRGTLYSLNWIPLGGFVKIKGVAGDDPNAHKQLPHGPDSFIGQTFTRKFFILFAGIGMNLLFAVVLFSIIFSIGMPSDPHTAPSGGKILQQQVVISSILSDGPAAQAQLQTGDIVLDVNGEPIDESDTLRSFSTTHLNEAINLHIQREKKDITVSITPTALSYQDQEFVGIGVGLQDFAVIRYPWYRSVGLGVTTTTSTTAQIFLSLYELVKNIFTTGTVSEDISGPIGIAVLTRQVAELGFIYLLQFMALLSINLGIFNLLPIPALDGGRIAFVILEKIRRKPVDQRIEGIVHTIGFLLLLVLILLVTLKDISQYHIFGFFKSRFF